MEGARTEDIDRDRRVGHIAPGQVEYRKINNGQKSCNREKIASKRQIDRGGETTGKRQLRTKRKTASPPPDQEEVVAGITERKLGNGCMEKNGNFHAHTERKGETHGCAQAKGRKAQKGEEKGWGGGESTQTEVRYTKGEGSAMRRAGVTTETVQGRRNQKEQGGRREKKKRKKEI